eukprot:6012702-Amphidinium_carterae.1
MMYLGKKLEGNLSKTNIVTVPLMINWVVGLMDKASALPKILGSSPRQLRKLKSVAEAGRCGGRPGADEGCDVHASEPLAS